MSNTDSLLISRRPGVFKRERHNGQLRLMDVVLSPRPAAPLGKRFENRTPCHDPSELPRPHVQFIRPVVPFSPPTYKFASQVKNCGLNTAHLP